MRTMTPLLQTLRRLAPRPTSPTLHAPLHVVMVDEELPYPADLGQAHPHAQPDAAAGAASSSDLPVPPQRRPGRGPGGRRVLRAITASQTVVVDRRRAAEIGPGVLRPPRGQPAVAAAVLGRLARPARRCGRRCSEHAAAHPVDLWHCEWTPYVQALRGVAAGRRVVIAHNVESVIWQRYYETETNALRRWYIGRQWRKFQRFERRVLREVGSHRGRQRRGRAALPARFRGRAGGRGGERRRYRLFPAAAARASRHRLLFLGSLDWRPNLDGVQLLLDDIFPAVRAAECRRRGSAWSAAIRPMRCGASVAELPGVELHAATCRTCGRTWRHAACWSCRCASAAARG